MPIIDLGKTLQWVVQWYQAYHQKNDMRQITEKEIMRYENLLNDKAVG